jgi:iron complex outermembrane receptor protein
MAKTLVVLQLKGVEVSLSTDVIRTDRLNWNLNFVTAFERKITKLVLILSERVIILGQGLQGQVHQVGFAPNSFSMYKIFH